MTDLKFPPFKWAQNAERVLMTINITDCENIEVDVSEEENKVKFSPIGLFLYIYKIS